MKQRDNGRWQARYRAPDGGERSRIFDRKRDADRWILDHEHAKSRGRWVDPRSGKATVEEWSRDWLATTVDLAASSRIRVEGIVRNYIVPRFGCRQVASVTHLEIKAWIAELSASGLARRTVRKIGQVFAAIMDAAVDARLMESDPTARVKLPEGSDHEPRFLTAGHALELADAIDDRYSALILIAGFGGLRFSELAGLRRGRVDVLRGTVHVCEAAVEAGGTVHHKPPKSDNSRRTVPLPPTAVQALTAHLERFTDADASALVFTSPRGEVLRAKNFRRRYFDPAVSASGLERLTPHDLRHTAVSLWILANTDVKTVSMRAGHSSTAFTLDRYGHLCPDADAGSVARLDALIADQSPTPTADVRRLRA